ncbi:MAG: hypothetical protein BWY27_00933 [Bacteroidetes bacterium ADurb.Bin234]|nr:MAG: hypothetical protein BWY27_00933 [Bacteroidetes bacterium ADurb.Bin234]
MDFVVKPIPNYLTKEWLLKKHYAKRIPSISYAFGLFDLSNIMQGVCTFGQPPSDQIQMACGEKYKDNTIELNRLIKNDGLPKNVQSWFVARCFEFLPKPMIIVSYSDPNYGHNGYTYQALNFLYTGKGGETKEFLWKGKRYNSRHIKDYWFKANKLPFNENLTIDQNFKNAGGEVVKVEMKHRYFYFLGDKRQVKDMKKMFTYNILPYPKGENTKYDASFKPTIQTQLF